MTKRGRQEPTQAVILPYEATKGDQAVRLYNLTGRTCQDWQAGLLRAIMATNPDGLWTHVKFGYSVPRRNGKSEILAMRELWGLITGERIMHTAHRTTTTHGAWEKLCDWVEELGIKYRAIRANGRELLEIPATGGRIDYRTRTSKGGLGEGVDLLVIDEAQEYQIDQESALKYIVTDSKNPQTLFCGTPPTPVSSGTVFAKLREQTLAGKSEDTGWAEWSVDEMTDPEDTAAWYRCNPSLGTVFTERDIRAEIGPDKADFNIQRLGLWIKHNLHSAISATDWAGLKASRLPELTGPLYAGIKYGKDGQNAALSIAVRTRDGHIFLEAIDCRPVKAGNAWIIDFLLNADVSRLVIDGQAGQAVLVGELRDAGVKIRLVLPKVKDVVAAGAAFERGIYDDKIRHAGQPSLVQVATNVEKRAIGSNGGFGYRSILLGADVALLESAILAYWACETSREHKRQQISY